MERRAVLGGMGAVLSSVLAGCAGSANDSGRKTFDPNDHVDDWQGVPVQGEADPIETEATVESCGDIDVRCGRVGRDALQSVVLDRVNDTTGLAFGFGRNQKYSGETSEEDEYILSDYRQITVERDGDVQTIPEISFSTLREVTPRVVHATINRNGTEIHTCQYKMCIKDQSIHVD